MGTADKLAEDLYYMFWKRNKCESIVPWSEQAPAIRKMWLSIARDARWFLETRDNSTT